MPKISELHNPSTSYTVTGQEELIVNTTSLSTVALSASDLIGATVDAVTTGQIQNFKSTHTDFKANSADYDNTKTTLNTYSGNWNYVATNSASLKANTTIDGKLTVGGTTTDPDNQLTVIGSISATGTVYSAGSAIGGGGGGSGTPGGSDKQFQYNDSSAFNGAAMYYNETSGNVGIGVVDTNNIEEKLSVVGNISATGKLYNEDGEVGLVTPGGADGAIQFNNSSTLSGNANLTFDDTNVRLGIGKPTPTSTLDVEATTNDGNTLVQLTQAGTGRGLGVNRNVASATRQMVSFAQLHSSGGSQPVVHIQQADSDEIALGVDTSGTVAAPTFCVKGDGGVGIGTASPSDYYSSANNLVIATNTNAGMTIKTGTGGNGWLVFADGTSGGDNTRGAVSYEHATNNMKFRVDNDVKMTILSSGKVGIGTNDPQQHLDVTKSINTSAVPVVVSNKDATSGTNQTVSLGFGLSRNSGAFKDTAGQIKVGREQDWTNDDLHIDAFMAFHVHENMVDEEKMRISSSGNVGINKTDPGYKLHVVESNTSTIAISAFGEIHAGGDIVSSSSSDRRQKTNIKKLDNALDKVLTLDGVEYDWNEMAAAHRIGKHDVGVIAQQVEEVLPDAVEHRETGMMAVRYERLVPLLIEAIKELKSEIDELKGK